MNKSKIILASSIVLLVLACASLAMLLVAEKRHHASTAITLLQEGRAHNATKQEWLTDQRRANATIGGLQRQVTGTQSAFVNYTNAESLRVQIMHNATTVLRQGAGQEVDYAKQKEIIDFLND